MNTGTENLTLSEKINKLSNFMKEHNYSLTHFLVNTEIVKSKKHEMGRIAKEFIPAGTTIAIIGGVFIDYVDEYIAMPLGSGIYLHQVNNNRKGTINHSCDPNCIMFELNKLTALRDICINEELNIDYGSTVAGKGGVVIANCKCDTPACRHVITSHDYLTMPEEKLSGLAKVVKQGKLKL